MLGSIEYFRGSQTINKAKPQLNHLPAAVVSSGVCEDFRIQLSPMEG